MELALFTKLETILGAEKERDHQAEIIILFSKIHLDPALLTLASSNSFNKHHLKSQNSTCQIDKGVIVEIDLTHKVIKLHKTARLNMGIKDKAAMADRHLLIKETNFIILVAQICIIIHLHQTDQIPQEDFLNKNTLINLQIILLPKLTIQQD